MLLYDCHCHSEHSHDSQMSIRAIAERAIELGLSGVTVTDHYDPNSPKTYAKLALDKQSTVLASIDEVCAVRDEYAGRLELLCGAELGSPFRYKDSCDVITCDNRVDQIIGSVHIFEPIYNNGVAEGYSGFHDEPREADRLIEAYFTDIFRNIAFSDIDVVGHISFLQRYIIRDGNILFDTKRYVDACADVMRTAISHGKAVEINSKSMYVSDNPVLSEFELMRMYRDLGGELVTIGTDAHSLDQFAAANEARDVLKAAGFKSACYYKSREPVFYSLD